MANYAKKQGMHADGTDARGRRFRNSINIHHEQGCEELAPPERVIPKRMACVPTRNARKREHTQEAMNRSVKAPYSNATLLPSCFPAFLIQLLRLVREVGMAPRAALFASTVEMSYFPPPIISMRRKIAT
jgi:hypothetical protein